MVFVLALGLPKQMHMLTLLLLAALLVLCWFIFKSIDWFEQI